MSSTVWAFAFPELPIPEHLGSLLLSSLSPEFVQLANIANVPLAFTTPGIPLADSTMPEFTVGEFTILAFTIGSAPDGGVHYLGIHYWECAMMGEFTILAFTIGSAP